MSENVGAEGGVELQDAGLDIDLDIDLDELAEEVSETIELIRPALQMDGGDIALVGIEEDFTVRVQLHGACVGCPASLQTLKAGVERIMKDRHPAVKEVVSI